MDHLPIEIFEYICDYLPFNDLFQLAKLRKCSDFYIIQRINNTSFNSFDTMHKFHSLQLQREYTLQFQPFTINSLHGYNTHDTLYMNPSNKIEVSVSHSDVLSQSDELVSRDMFIDIFIKQVNDLKKHYFGSTDFQVILERNKT